MKTEFEQILSAMQEIHDRKNMSVFQTQGFVFLQGMVAKLREMGESKRKAWASVNNIPWRMYHGPDHVVELIHIIENEVFYYVTGEHSFNLPESEFNHVMQEIWMAG